MRNFFLYVFFFLLFSCHSNTAQKSVNQDSLNSANSSVFSDHQIDTLSLGLNFIPKDSYTNTKMSVESLRVSLYSLYSSSKNATEKEKILDSARFVFTNVLLNDIVPHWYGTVWDFNGYTEKPNKGLIACGYFVSTTLKHMGVNLNRYKFAQQWGINEAKTLEPDSLLDIYNLEGTFEIPELIKRLEENLKDGLYFVGLDNHVGYIYRKNNVLYFLHSNYIDGYVMIEKALYSEAFRSSVYVIADITHNSLLIKKWLSKQFIQTVKQ